MTQKIILLNKVPIRIDFDGDDAERFQYVKKYLGLKQNTEVIRALISGKYNEISTLRTEAKGPTCERERSYGMAGKGRIQLPYAKG